VTPWPCWHVRLNVQCHCAQSYNCDIPAIDYRQYSPSHVGTMGILLYNPATDNEENTVLPETPSAQLILQMFSNQLAVLKEKAAKTSHTSSSTAHARNMSSAVGLVCWVPRQHAFGAAPPCRVLWSCSSWGWCWETRIWLGCGARMSLLLWVVGTGALANHRT